MDVGSMMYHFVAAEESKKHVAFLSSMSPYPSKTWSSISVQLNLSKTSQESMCTSCKRDTGSQVHTSFFNFYQKLTPAQIASALEILQGWQLTPCGNKIRRDIDSKNFLNAIGFLISLAEVAELQGHHPGSDHRPIQIISRHSHYGVQKFIN